jgi:hypothetical protein
MLLEADLASYYSTSFKLQKDFGFNLSNIDEMFPFEYKVYLNEVLKYVEEEKKRLEAL